MTDEQYSPLEALLRSQVLDSIQRKREHTEAMTVHAMQMKRHTDAAVSALRVISDALAEVGDAPRDLYLQALRDAAGVREQADETTRSLARYLVDQGMSTVAVAKAAGVAQSTVSRWTSTPSKG